MEIRWMSPVQTGGSWEIGKLVPVAQLIPPDGKGLGEPIV